MDLARPLLAPSLPTILSLSCLRLFYLNLGYRWEDGHVGLGWPVLACSLFFAYFACVHLKCITVNMDSLQDATPTITMM